MILLIHTLTRLTRGSKARKEAIFSVRMLRGWCFVAFLFAVYAVSCSYRANVGSKDALGKYVILGYLFFMINDNVYVRDVCSQWGGVYGPSMSNK